MRVCQVVLSCIALAVAAFTAKKGTLRSGPTAAVGSCVSRVFRITVALAVCPSRAGTVPATKRQLAQLSLLLPTGLRLMMRRCCYRVGAVALMRLQCT